MSREPGNRVVVNGKRLAELRHRCGWTQQEAARKSGYSDRLIRKLESDGLVKQATLIDVLEAYADFLRESLAIDDYRLGHTREQIEEIFRRWFDGVFNRRDRSLIDELVHPEVVLTAEGEVRQGRGVIRTRIETLLNAFEPLELTVEKVMIEGDTAVAYWHVRKKHVGEFAGIAPTGKWVELRGSSWARIHFGQIIEARDHWDVHDLIRKLRGEDSSPV